MSAILEDRHFIGIEKNEDALLHKVKPTDYIKVCNQRIEETKQKIKNEQPELSLFANISAR
ncbi:MAG: hypothetical protein WCI64_07385 [Chlorobium sp.]